MNLNNKNLIKIKKFNYQLYYTVFATKKEKKSKLK
jgi:hypothetical protein